MQERERFNSWAIVEVMGHNKFAGKVSEQVVAGQGFVRVDVPALPERKGRYNNTTATPAFTKLLGAGSIYAITPCTEEIAVRAADQFRVEPISCLDLTQVSAAIAAPTADGSDDELPF